MPKDSDVLPDETAQYADRVHKLVLQTDHRDELNKWCADKYGQDGGNTAYHICTVFATSGIANFEGRQALADAAVKQQREVRHNKRKEKQDKLREAAKKEAAQPDVENAGVNDVGGTPAVVDTIASDASVRLAGGRGRMELPVPDGLPPLSAGWGGTLTKVINTVAEQSQPKWEEVQSFKTQEEALRFIIECQPFDYHPDIADDGVNFPRFESARDMFNYIASLDPMPLEYTCAGNCRRRLRLRKIESDEQREKEIEGLSKGSRKEKPRKSLATQRHGISGTTQHVLPPRELKAYAVEVSGALFERPASLRDLRDNHTARASGSLPAGVAGTDGGGAVSRYYIAVAPQEEKQILQEGYRCKLRVSIPCCATPREAIAAFNRNEQLRIAAASKPSFAADGSSQIAEGTQAPSLPLDRPVAPKVLAITVPQELAIDVVAHRDGGFQIRCKELAPRFFRKMNKTD